MTDGRPPTHRTPSPARRDSHPTFAPRSRDERGTPGTCDRVRAPISSPPPNSCSTHKSTSQPLIHSTGANRSVAEGGGQPMASGHITEDQKTRSAPHYFTPNCFTIAIAKQLSIMQLLLQHLLEDVTTKILESAFYAVLRIKFWGKQSTHPFGARMLSNNT